MQFVSLKKFTLLYCCSFCKLKFNNTHHSEVKRGQLLLFRIFLAWAFMEALCHLVLELFPLDSSLHLSTLETTELFKQHTIHSLLKIDFCPKYFCGWLLLSSFGCC